MPEHEGHSLISQLAVGQKRSHPAAAQQAAGSATVKDRFSSAFRFRFRSKLISLLDRSPA